MRLALLALLAAGTASAQGLVHEVSDAGVVVRNAGPAPVVALRIGGRRVARLAPGETMRVTPDHPDEPAVVAGRYDPRDWATALADLSAGAAETHLRTAGYYLDAVDAGPEGEPQAAINLRLLAAVDRATAAEWVAGPPLRLALVARAALHAPAALEPLLGAVDPDAAPDEAPDPWPEPYGSLASPADGARIAIEAAGVAALAALDAHPRWAADRGIGPVVRRAFEGARGGLGDAPPPGALAAALDAGDFDEAAALAGRMASVGGLDSSAARLVCGALDTAAAGALRSGRWLAAEGWLRWAGPWCGPTAAFRARVAALWRARGDALRVRGDLVGAIGWYRPAFWLAEAAPDRARLADMHGLLALLRYGGGQIEAGDRHLAEARALDSLRPVVQDAIAAKPEPDLRARVAMVVIIAFLGVFAARRLRRVLGGRPRGRIRR